MAVDFKTEPNGDGYFTISEAGKQLADMRVTIDGSTLTAHHTGVIPEAEGRGLAKELFNAMVDYARAHKLYVVPLCVFVNAQLRRHPEQYADIWKK